MAAPALAIALVLRFIGPYADHPGLRGMLQSAVLARAALLAMSAVPLAKHALGPLTVAVAVLGTLVFRWSRVPTAGTPRIRPEQTAADLERLLRTRLESTHAGQGYAVSDIISLARLYPPEA